MNRHSWTAGLFVLALGTLDNSATYAKSPSKDTLESRCIAEAQWPVIASPAYKNASVLHQVQLRDGYDADVSEGASLCGSLASATAVERQDLKIRSRAFVDAQSRKFGARGAGHAGRLDSLYAALALNEDTIQP